MSKPDRPLRVGLLGCGSFAQRHIQVLAQLEGEVELAACCDRNEWKARALADQFTAGRAGVFTRHRQMFEQARLDLAAICLPPYGHSDEVEAAAEHGVHILMEKPIALTAEHAWRMVAAAERAPIKTQVGFMFRFGAAIEQVQQMLASGAAGRPGLMSARYFCNALHATWWRDRERSGGQVVEQAIHMLDLMRHLFGEAETVYSRQANLFHQAVPGYTAEDVSATVIAFRNGALGVLYATNAAIPNRWINDYRIVAQKITADFTNANQATVYFTDAPDRPPLNIAADRNVYLSEWRDLLDAIYHDGTPRTPLREGALSLDLALAAARSAEVRGEVRV